MGKYSDQDRVIALGGIFQAARLARDIARTGSEEDGHDNQSWFASGGLERERWGLRGLVRRARTESDFDPTPPDENDHIQIASASCRAIV